MNCEMCRFWMFPPYTRVDPRATNPTAKSEVGQCRRYPPRNVNFERPGERGVETLFPVTHGTTWCGEFRSVNEDGGIGPGGEK